MAQQVTYREMKSLTGNLGANPVTRQTPSGKTVVEFPLAVNEDGKRVWYRVAAWGDLGEQYARGLRKGDFVKARGRYHEEHWTDEQGQARRTRKVTATFVRQLRARTVVREPKPTYGQLMLALHEEAIPLPLPGQ
jgi:single stranded DNA-binding protein